MEDLFSPRSSQRTPGPPLGFSVLANATQQQTLQGGTGAAALLTFGIISEASGIFHTC